MKLADLYGTAQNTVTPSEEEQAKIAAAEDQMTELFVKVAQENNIDLDAMSDEEMSREYSQFVDAVRAKIAEEESKKDDKGDKKDDKAPPFAKKDGDDAVEKKVAAAREEFGVLLQKNAQAHENDLTGQQIAHAMMATLQKIASGQTETAEERSKIASQVAVANFGPTPALNEAAYLLALDKIASIEGATEATVKEAGDRIRSLFTLNKFDDSDTKIASAVNTGDFAAAVDIRALEMLEQVGYTINWNQG